MTHDVSDVDGSPATDDWIDKIEVKLVGDYLGDYLGDKEAEVMLTRQGLAGVRCDGAYLPQWSAYVPIASSVSRS